MNATVNPEAMQETPFHMDIMSYGENMETGHRDVPRGRVQASFPKGYGAWLFLQEHQKIVREGIALKRRLAFLAKKRAEQLVVDAATQFVDELVAESQRILSS